VLAQSPAPGLAIERGSRVDVWLAAPADSLGRTLPDLAGRPVREALRELGRRQVAVKLDGHGTVVRMDPPPGTPLPLDRPCVLHCEPRARVAPPPVLAPGEHAIATASAGGTRP